MVDHPDWLQGQVVFSQAQSIVLPANPQTTPFVTTFDTSLFNSLDISLASVFIPATSANLAVTVQWFNGTTQVGSDSFTVRPQSVSLFDEPALVSMPVRGNSCKIIVASSAGNEAFSIWVAGSSRSVTDITYSGYLGTNAGFLGGISSTAIAAGARVDVFFGPLSKPCDLWLVTPAAGISHALTAFYVDDTGNVSNRVVFNVSVGAASSVRTQNILMPNMVLQYGILNTTAGALTVTALAFGG